MKILIVAATSFEIEPLLHHLGTAQYIHPHFSRTTYHRHQLDILITGVGMIFTTYHLTRTLGDETYDFALNAGVAGAIDDRLPLTAVVHVVNDYFYELGAEDRDEFLSIADLGLLQSSDYPYTREGITNENYPKFFGIDELTCVNGHTVNTVHGNEQSILKMKKRSKAQIESMEGAAFMYCCMQQKVPCLQIRAISNHVEIRNKSNWKLHESIQNLNHFLIQGLNQIP